MDGLPLALELAAARIKFFAPEQLLAWLEHRLSFFTDGPRDLPARQQTLRGMIDWSYNLLSAAEQALLLIMIEHWRWHTRRCRWRAS